MRTDSTYFFSGCNAAALYIHDAQEKHTRWHKPIQGKLPEGAQDAHEAVRPTDVTRTPEA